MGAGTDNTVTLTRRRSAPPSDPGYVPDRASAMSSAAALGLLEASGSQVDTNTSVGAGPDLTTTSEHRAAGSHPRPDQQGRRTVNAGHRGGRERSDWWRSPTAADQLRDVGIAATVLCTSVTLYHDARTTIG